MFAAGWIGRVFGAGWIGKVFDAGRVGKISGEGRVGKVSDARLVEFGAGSITKTENLDSDGC